jgi:hypothetical protein
VYSAVYGKHAESFCVFGTYTRMSDFEKESDDSHIMTEWGFKGADFPIIKSEKRFGEWRYYIALNTAEDD